MAATETQKKWTVRAGDAFDAGAIADFWVREYRGARGFAGQMSPEDYALRHRPRVEAILSRPLVAVRLAVDPEEPRIFWGFVVTEGADIVHIGLVKRDYRKIGFGVEIMTDLLGDRLRTRQYYTHDLEGFRRAGVLRFDERTKREVIPSGEALDWINDPWACATRPTTRKT